MATKSTNIAVLGVAAFVIAAVVAVIVSRHKSSDRPNADGPCVGTDEPIHLQMLRKDDGSTVPDLTMCTNQARTISVITNTSSDTVWYVKGWTPYWTESDDVGLGATVQIFRAGLRSAFGVANNTPYLTVEPGVRATIPRTPSSIELDTSPPEQAAWQAAALTVNATKLAADRLRESAQGALEDVLADGSKTREAVIKCAELGYNFGQTLTETHPAGELLDQLKTSYQDGEGCFQQIRTAQLDAELTGQEAPLLLDEMDGAAHESSWLETGDRLLTDALEGLAAWHRG